MTDQRVSLGNSDSGPDRPHKDPCLARNKNSGIIVRLVNNEWRAFEQGLH